MKKFGTYNFLNKLKSQNNTYQNSQNPLDLLQTVIKLQNSTSSQGNLQEENYNNTSHRPQNLNQTEQNINQTEQNLNQKEPPLTCYQEEYLKPINRYIPLYPHPFIDKD